MDPDQTRSSAPRKVRFPPKTPPRRNPKPPDPKTEVVDDARSHDKELLRRVNKHLGKQGPQVEKNSSVQVTFGAASSDSIRAYGRRGEGNTGRSKDSGLKDSDSGDEQIVFSLPSTAKPDGTTSSSANAVDASYQKKQKKYKEPWDYLHSNHPISLPLRRPNSGDPELLDEAEFGDAAINLEYDEKNVNPALELGLLEENNKPQMFFLQFPDNLPLVKQSASANGKERTDSSKPSGSTGASAGAKGKEIAGRSTVGDTSVKGKETVGSSMPLETSNASMMGCSLNELPGGYMGKMFVYKSGAIKWKLGEVIHDVSPGVSCKCFQDVVAINTADENCCALGEIGKRVVVTPDIDSLLDNVIELE
ncbi:hypothetical protein CsSME_00001424 [Camellia sinensis var. sinensis]